MTNAERIEVLRYCGADKGCLGCPLDGLALTDCFLQVMIDAADALKAAEKRIAELERILKAVQENSGINFRLWQEAEAMMQTVTECHTLEDGE